MDGWITIGTELSTDKFDKQLGSLNNKIKKEEDKKIIIETKLTSQQQELEKARKKVDELSEAYHRMKQAQDAIESGIAKPKQFTDYFGMQGQYGSLENLSNSFDKALSKQDAIEQKLQQMRAQYDAINGKVSEYKQKIDTINLERHQRDIDNVKNGFNNLGNSIQKTITKVGKLALGIFSVRSAYMFLRRASSELASYDPQYAANLEYIRFVLTQAIAPVLRYIVNLAATLLQYLNAIMQSWFGINLFSQGSVENFNKMKQSAGGVGKAVKEIKKQLLGFDEINMLTDQSDTGTSAGAGGVGLSPDFDLGKEVEIPDWLQWIINHKDDILKLIAAMAGWKVGKSVLEFLNGAGILKDLPKGLRVLAGLTIMITSLSFMYEGIKGFQDGEISSDDMLRAVGGALGLGVGAGILTASVPVGLLVALGGLEFVYAGYGQSQTPYYLKKLLGLKDLTQTGPDEWAGQADISMIIYLSQAVISNLETIIPDIRTKIQRALLDMIEGIVKWVRGLPFIGDALSWILDGVLSGIEAMKNPVTETSTKAIEESATTSMDLARTKINEKAKETAGETGITWMNTMKKKIQDDRANLEGSIKNTITDASNNAQQTAETTGRSMGEKQMNGMKLGQASKRGELTNELSNTIATANNNADTSSSRSVGANIVSGIQSGINGNSGGLMNTISNIGSMLLRNFKNVLGIHSPSRAMAELAEFIPLGIAEGINRTSNKAIESMKSLVTGLEGTVSDAEIGYDINTGLPVIPKQALSTNGIIGIPNTGSYIGTGITSSGMSSSTLDNETMAELGREIGKNVLVNLTNITEMNGRVISRELKAINQQQDFAYNP